MIHSPLWMMRCPTKEALRDNPVSVTITNPFCGHFSEKGRLLRTYVLGYGLFRGLIGLESGHEIYAPSWGFCETPLFCDFPNMCLTPVTLFGTDTSVRYLVPNVDKPEFLRQLETGGAVFWSGCSYLTRVQMKSIRDAMTVLYKKHTMVSPIFLMWRNNDAEKNNDCTPDAG